MTLTSNTSKAVHAESSSLSTAVTRSAQAHARSLSISPVQVLPQLELREVSQIYPNLEDPEQPLEILKSVTLSLSAGDMVALSGPSGSGKSTLLQVIAGHLSPAQGEVWWGDLRLDQQSEDERARWRLEHVGLIFQDFRLFPHLSALENAALPLELLGASTRDATAAAIPLLKQLGLNERLHHRPHALSGGEQQRVAIARALVHRPTLILADEPTGNLDSASARKVEDLLLSLPHLRQVGLLYVTHDLSFAQRAETHYGLHEGQLIQRT